MTYIFLLTLLLSTASLIVGLIKPSIFQRAIKIIPKRKTVAIVCCVVMVVSFFGIGMTAPKIEKPINNEVASAESESKESVQTNGLEVVAENQPATTTEEQSKPKVQQTQNVQTTQTEKTTIIPTPATQNNSQYEYYSVSSVVDGDTVKVNINGTVETLRLIGMDTPETVDPRKPVQCFGKEASNKAKELLIGKKVRIEKDSTQGEFDKYNRRLAYIYREDGLFYNKHMIEQGYAHEYTYNTPYKYQAEFKAAQKSAQENLIGLWSPNTCNGDTTTSVTEPSASQTTTNNQATGKYYTSSFRTSKYYYPASCPEWQNLSQEYLKAFDSLEALLATYPSRTLSPQCQ
jgi:endonuclease YncB( thermonuclease family)